MRILALDYGQKRVGMALTDQLQMMAQPKGFLPYNKGVFAALAKFVTENEVIEIVLGYPKSLNGTIGAMAKEVEVFEQELKKFVTVPIILWDERFTTSQAENFLIHAEVRRDDRKGLRDSISAALLLQSYLIYKQSSSTLLS